MSVIAGGLDSHVLLHALNTIKSKLNSRIHALHVNHGFSANASRWSEHCQDVCEQLEMDFTLLTISNTRPEGESLEAWARKLRYELMFAELAADNILLTAHHVDDQAETLLLQMLRGAGVKGLAAMPRIKKVNGSWHGRPLLNIDRQALEAYAEEHNLQWVEDESNKNTAFDRNYLRQHIYPLLKERWPAVNRTLARVAGHQSEALLLMDEIARSDLSACLRAGTDVLKIEELLKISVSRRINVIRYWLRKQKLSVPNARKMREIVGSLLPARIDAAPLISWQGGEIRRYRQALYAGKPLQPFQSDSVFDWKLDSDLHLQHGVLSAVNGKGRGIKSSVCPQGRLQVRFRQGGERLHLHAQGNRRELKKLFQETAIPPWIRNRMPLLYMNDELLAVAGMWIDRKALADSNEEGWDIRWSGLDGIDNKGR